MSRKKLTNKDKFVFNETEFVNHLGNRALSEQSSVQKRLFPKAEIKKPASNPPASGYFSPLSIPIHNDGTRPGRDHMINKKDPTADPCVEEVVEKLAKLNTEFLRITVNVKDDTRIRRIQMFPPNPPPTVNSKKVLLQVVPKSTGQFQEILHPFKADYKKTNDSINNNFVLNNNKSLEMSFTNNPKETSTSNENSTEIKNKPSPLTWKPPVMLKRGSAPDNEAISERNVLQTDQPGENSCICVRPLKLILCPVCSYTTSGRLRKTCQVHPKDVYLLDLDVCPRCKETNKFVLKEYDLPEGFKKVINNLVA